MIVYGIPNCNTVKKALDWLKANELDFEFHDYKKKGITKEKLEDWATQIAWESLVNKKGTTWRQLPPEVQNTINNKEAAFSLIIQKPSVTKRPIIESNGKIICLGFDESQYVQLIK
ncbi:MAG: ArsC family reductase [Sphingobacteriaceae bacterium]